MNLTIQLITFGIVMLAWLAFRCGTARRLGAEDALRREEETSSQTRTRHRLETGFVSVFWVAVVGLWLVTLIGRLAG